MDKQELLRAMNTALKSTRQKDKIYKEYMGKVRAVNEAEEKLDSFPILARIKLSIIPFILFCISAGSQKWEESKLFYNITLALFILLIAVNVFGKYIYLFTAEYKRKSEMLKVQREDLRKEYIPQFKQHIETSKSVLPQLGEKYHTTHALEHMVDYLQSGRAETIKELIEVYELDCHRMRMEESQRRALDEVATMQDEINALSSQLNYVTYYKK